MKILIDARLYGLENAGLGRYSMNLINNLSKIDYKNTYIILLRKKYFDSLDLPPNWKKVLADFQHYGFKEQFLLPNIIKKEKPDLTHFLHFNVPFLTSGRFMVTIHDLLMHRNKGLEATTLSAPMYFLKRLGYKTIFKNAVVKSARILVPSNAIKSELIENYSLSKDKIEVVYEGVDDNISNSTGIDIKSPYFVYTGNAYPHKNLKRLIEAMVILNKSSNQKVKLAISSSRNVFTERLQKTVKDLQATEYIEILGFVPDEKLGSLYKNSIAFVFPSLSEGFGLPGLEALESRTLLLASNIPIFKEIYKDQAIYFDPLDPNSIAGVMKNIILLDKKSREEKIKSGEALARTYSWNRMAKETLKIYEEFR